MGVPGSGVELTTGDDSRSRGRLGRGRHRTQSAESPLRDRLVLLVATALYAVSLFGAYVHYLNPRWEYMGFSYRPPGIAEATALVILIGAVAAVLPSRLQRPSALVLMLLFVVVFVPGMMVTFCLETDRIARYGPFAAAMTLVFVVASLVSDNGGHPRPRQIFVPGRGFGLALVAIAFPMAAALLIQYRDVMSFVALDDVYEQRAAGASTGPVMSYMQTYFSNVISPALIALGLVKRQPLTLAAGIGGCLLMYAINAQKTLLLLPFAMVALNLLVTSRFGAVRAVGTPVLVFALLTAYAVQAWEDDILAGALALFFVHRTIAVPGLTLTQYFDQFNAEGFTFWSHVKGVDLLVPAPAAYASDPLWPGLGYMLGDRLFGRPDFNMNANLFSGDGIAAAGAAGVIVIGLFLIVFLWLLDRAAVAWERRFALLVVLPVALALTNGHFFTTLLSFGGLFWLITFAAVPVFVGRRSDAPVP